MRGEASLLILFPAAVPISSELSSRAPRASFPKTISRIPILESAKAGELGEDAGTDSLTSMLF